MISAWLLYFLVYQLLSKVDDVTAQNNCVISPNITTLTIRDGLIRNIELHCQCMDDNGMITTGTSWFRGSTSFTGTINDPNFPTDAPSILFIAMPFDSSVAGTYTCSPDSTFPNVPPGDSITLNAQVAAASPPRSCNVISTSLPTVSTPSGVIANGTEDVILYCICIEGGVAVGPTEWSFNSVPVTATQANGTNPYYRNNVSSPLIIPLFVTGNDGTYECGSLGTLYDSITLTLPVNPQATCVISPNISNLAIRDGLVRNVEFHCQCMDDNGMITTGTSWFRGSTLYTGTLNDTNLPTDAPSILLIPLPFNSSVAGTYICSPVSTFTTMLPPGDAITLTTSGNAIPPRTCNIISTSLPTLTTPSGVIANGTEDVILYCICVQNNVAVGPVLWFFNDTQVTDTQFNGSSPYYRDNVPCPLIIPLFVAGNDGTYRCGSDINIESTSDNNITLTLSVTPTITTPMEGQQFNIIVGSNGSITCTATGYPVPTVVWQNSDGSSLSNNRLVSGSPVNISSTGVGNETSVSVELMVIGAMRVDTGMYRCSANNSVDSTSRNITITVQYGPSIIGPMNQAINEGGIASFKCQASGEPLPTISWYFNGVPLDDSNTAKYMITGRLLPNANMSVLNIMSVASSDVGTYTCNATNVVSTDSSFGVLIVNVSPTITTLMEGQQFNVIEGRNGSITCTATGYPVPTVVWQNSDGSSLSNNRLVSGPVNMSPTGVGNEVSVSVELMMIGAIREDDRMYRCSANNSVGNTTTNIRIIIQFGPSTTRVTNLTENEGGTASFVCEADGVPIPIFSWYFNGVLLDDSNTAKYEINSRNDFSILTIISVESSDVGTYTCNATNVVSSDTSYGVLTVNVSPTITTPMEGQQFNVIEGRNGSITCTATGYPVPAVVWQSSNGSSLSNNRLVSGLVNMSSTGVGNVTSVSVELMVIGAMRVDTGMYRCSASNSVGNDANNININVQFAPEIIIPPNSITVINGSEVVLNCTVVGNPLPAISWFVVGGVNLSTLISNGVRVLFDNQGRIINSLINNTVLSSTTIHSRMRLPETAPFVAGEYSCRASNFLRSINRTATLTVYVPPTVITPNGSRVVTVEGTSLLVDCTAAGIPPPNITWQDPSGTELPNDDNMRIILQDRTVPQLMADDGFTFLYHVIRTLVINNANDIDTGNYTCIADNGVVAMDNNAVEVFVRVVPVITASPISIPVVSPDGAAFSCNATAKPRAVIQWTINNGTVLTDTLEKFTISNIVEGDCMITNPSSECVITSILEIADGVPNDDGEYVCTAINPAGNVTASASLTVYVEPNILQPVENSVFTINETDTYSITCNATGIPAPMTFIWLKDGVVQNYSLNATDRISVSQPSDPVPYSTSDGDVQSVSQLLIISPAVGLTTNSAMGNDSGVYTCQVSNGVGDGASVSVELVVQVPPVVVPESSPVIGVEGNSAVLRFFVINAFPPVTIDNVRWLLSRGGIITDITNNTMVDNNTLTFQSNSTAQMYSLTISNIQPNYISRFYLTVSNPAGVDTNFTNFIVEGPPDIEIGPADVTEIDDSDVKLVCDAIAFPQHSITWMFQRTTANNSAMIINTLSPDPTMKYLIDDNVNSTSYGTLTITNLQYSDRGVYTCIAANVHGTVSAEAMVSVQVKPTNDMIVGGGRVNISLPINLTCTVIGVPLPAIVWQLNGNDINLTSDCVENSYNASLDFGSELVYGSPNCCINQTLNLLDDVVASTVSDPQDVITLGMYELSQLVVESTLTIRSLKRSDNGSYTCYVTNMLPGVSIVTDSVPIVVLERPEPVNVTVQDKGSRWVLVGWDAPYNGNSEIDGYIVYLKNVDSDSNFIQVSSSAGGMRKRQLPSQLTTTSTSYNITEGILPVMQYQFTAVACNQLGCGEFGVPSQDISTNEERPETPPVNCSAAAINSTAIMIMWSPPVMPNGVITNYNVSYVPGQSLSTADYSADGNVSVAIGNNDTAYVVTGLRIATDYYVAIAAHTMVGVGPYSNDNCTVQTMEDVPDGPPLNVILTSPTSTSISINWDLPDPLVRNGIITKHQLNYTEVTQPLNWTIVLLNGSTSYFIEGLKIFTQYYVSVRAGTQVTGFGLFSDPKIIRTFIPAPLNLIITSVTENTMSLSWKKPSMLDEVIVDYQVSYASKLSSKQSTNINDTNIVLDSLSSGVQYFIVVTAITDDGERIDSSNVTKRTLNTAFFQIRLRPIANCEEWTVDDDEQKQSDIEEIIVEEIMRQCSCDFNTDNIIDESFSCRGSQGQFIDTVVYRAMISLQVPASTNDADNIVTLLGEWVESEPSVRVNRVTLNIDSNCPTMLESFDSDDCEVSTEGTNSSPSSPSQSPSSSPTSIIIGAAVATAVVVLFSITVVVIIIMYRRHKSSYSVTKQDENVYDYIATQPLPTRVRDHPVNKSVSNDNDIAMDANPAYGEGFRTAGKTIKTGDDGEYETVDTQTRQVKAADITMVNNPAYAETTFTK